MTSIISFFVLLLVTYSYSVPVGKFLDTSTVNYDFTTDKTMVDHELIHGEQSTGTPNIHKKQIDLVDIPVKQTIDVVDIPVKQTIEEHRIEASYRIQDINRRREPPVQGGITQDVDRRREPPVQGGLIENEELLPAQDIDRRREPPVQGGLIENEGLLPAQDINRRREPPVQGGITQDVDRRREPPVQGGLIENEELLPTQDIDRRREPPVQGGLIQDVDRRREPPVQGGLIENEELLPAQDIDRRREPPVQGGLIQDVDRRRVRGSIDEHDGDEITTTAVYRPLRTFEESSIPSTTDVYRPLRTFEESSIPSTTDVYRPLRTFEESSIPTTTIRSTLDYSSTHEENDKRSLEDEFSVRALVSTAEFNRRAIRPIITETTSEIKEEIPLLTRTLSENNIETTTNIKSSSEPLSSIDSFGKITGLLPDSSNDVSTTTQSSFVNKHVQQLSQVQKQPVVETTKPN